MRLGRFVTVKVLKDEYAENSEFLTKFSSEASAAASLSHHNILAEVERITGEPLFSALFRRRESSE